MRKKGQFTNKKQAQSHSIHNIKVIISNRNLKKSYNACETEGKNNLAINKNETDIVSKTPFHFRCFIHSKWWRVLYFVCNSVSSLSLTRYVVKSRININHKSSVP